MKIERVAIWVKDLDAMKAFYETYFNGIANAKYCNKEKNFESYFLIFDEGARLEIMCKSEINEPQQACSIGWAHIAFSLGSREVVNQVTERLQEDGYQTVDGPRVTGDGYYESVIQDPEGNYLELTV